MSFGRERLAGRSWRAALQLGDERSNGRRCRVRGQVVEEGFEHFYGVVAASQLGQCFSLDQFGSVGSAFSQTDRLLRFFPRLFVFPHVKVGVGKHQASLPLLPVEGCCFFQRRYSALVVLLLVAQLPDRHKRLHIVGVNRNRLLEICLRVREVLALLIGCAQQVANVGALWHLLVRSHQLRLCILEFPRLHRFEPFFHLLLRLGRKRRRC